MKKTIIICTAIMVLAIGGTIGTFFVGSDANAQSSDFQVPMRGNAITDDMTFEDYSSNFKDDVTDEQVEEAKEIFQQIKQAMLDEDTELITNLTLQLNQLNLFENSQNGMDVRQGRGNQGGVVDSIVGGTGNQGGRPGK